MDYKVILNLMKEMNQNGLTKLEIEEEGVHICMEKAVPVSEAQPAVPSMMAPPVMGMMPSYPMGQMMPQTSTTNATNVQVNTSPEGNTTVEKEEVSGKKLVSPMVGTFYSQPSPDKPPFVKVGDHVKKGQTVCIIEAMKLMNEIEAEQDGEVVKILINNEEMVEYGQPLFIVK